MMQKVQQFMKVSREWREAAAELRKTINQSHHLLTTTRFVHGQNVKHDPIFPPVSVSKLLRAKQLYQQHKGSRQEMIVIFMRELNMSEAGAKTYCTQVMPSQRERRRRTRVDLK